MRTLVAVVAVAASLAGCAADETQVGAREDGRVERYCLYGSVSQAQLDGCFDHVTLGDITSRDTNAAEYALGKLDECLDDAGPYCGQ